MDKETEKLISTLESNLDSFEKKYANKKKFSNTDIKALFSLAFLSFKFTVTSYKRVVQLAEISHGLTDAIRSILKLMRQLVITIFIIVLLINFKDPLSSLVGIWLKFAIEGWNKTSMDVKYGFLVIAPISFLLGLLGRWLRKKVVN